MDLVVAIRFYIAKPMFWKIGPLSKMPA